MGINAVELVVLMGWVALVGAGIAAAVLVALRRSGHPGPRSSTPASSTPASSTPASSTPGGTPVSASPAAAAPVVDLSLAERDGHHGAASRTGGRGTGGSSAAGVAAPVGTAQGATSTGASADGTSRGSAGAGAALAPAESDTVVAQARAQAAAMLDRAAEDSAAARRERESAESEIRALKAEVRALREDLERREQRLRDREERLDGELAHRSSALDDRQAGLEAEQARLAEREAALDALETERRAALERAAGLTAEQAHDEVVAGIVHQAKLEAAKVTQQLERAARAEGEARARHIVATAVQRVASEQTAESTVAVLHLPSDDMKGHIIGREGRNIRCFEALTGVNLIVDEAPESVMISCFDPVRREVARVALEALVEDGRIHPQRIEEAVERAQVAVEETCVRAGEEALVEAGVLDVHPDLVAHLGRLRYRTSYGQNVLRHLVESAHVAGVLAAELGVDVALVKRCALLHDIGKGLTHESEGSHAAVGAELARRYGETEDVVHAIAAHHDEVEPRTLEAVLTQAADAVSASRPGARRESLEAYVSRMHALEDIATAHDGVDRAFAMQAGRDLRVVVLPDRVDDIGAQVIARDIAKQVEEELTYPGQVRVTVVRESRAVEVAR